MRRRALGARGTPRWPAIVVVASLVLVGGCGGSSGEADTPLPTLPDGGADRPEGVWSFVTIERERSDHPDLDPGTAQVRRYRLRPSCKTGPCDLAVTPAGQKGTAYPEGVTLPAGTKASGKNPPFTWDPAERAYTRKVTQTVTCTNAKGEQIEDGYRLDTTTKLTFAPPRGGRPSGLEGTYEQEAGETDAGRGKGCTPFTTSGDVVAGPVGALSGKRWPDLDGSYVATETVEAVEPSDERRPPGLVGLLGEQRIEGREGARITGVLDAEADLVATKDGLAGRGRTSGPCVLDDREVADGFDSTETWTDLLPLALTRDGRPILGGRWRLYQNPTAAGVKAGCSLATNAGYVILVPKEVVG